MSNIDGRSAQLTALAARLRQWQGELKAGGGFDPRAHFIAKHHAGGFIHGGVPSHELFGILEDAKRRGAFSLPCLSHVGDHLDPTRPNDSILRVLDDLQQLGFDCWGVQPGKAALDRLAGAFGALATAPAKPAEKHGRLTATKSWKEIGDALGCSEKPAKERVGCAVVTPPKDKLVILDIDKAPSVYHHLLIPLLPE